MTAYKYKGFDWTELAVGFKLCKAKEIRGECLKDEDGLAKRIRDFVDNNANALMDTTASDERKAQAKATADSIRQFLKAMVKCRVTNEVDLWLGLAKCDDDTVLKYTHVLLEYMWT